MSLFGIITFIGLALTALSLVATLLVPKLIGRKLIFISVQNVFSIDLGDLDDEGNISLSYNGSDIAKRIVRFDAKIENTGAGDIDKDNLTQPINITAPTGAKILSVKVTVPDDVNLDLDLIEENQIQLKWDLLKKKESMYIHVVCADENETFSRISFENIKTVCRLKDVYEGQGLYQKIRVPLAVAVISLIFCLPAALVLLGPYIEENSSNIYFSQESEARVLIIDDEDVLNCKAFEDWRNFPEKSCTEVEFGSNGPAIHFSEDRAFAGFDYTRLILGALSVFVIVQVYIWGFLALSKNPLLRMILRRAFRLLR